MPAIDFHCPFCAQRLEAPGEAAGHRLPCPKCQMEIMVPAETRAPVESAAAVTRVPGESSPAGSPVCAICLSPIQSDQNKASCPACRAEYHADCWEENGGCAVYGCAQVPAVEQRHAVEIPVSYWGQENKPCPACGREILAAAVRCRHCGATFASARPEDSAEFQQRSDLEKRLPAVRRTVIWLFIFCVLPCLAPIGAIWGVVWYPAHRQEVNALPSLYPALCKIGLGVAIAQAIALVVLGLLYSVVRGS
jgi:hypothetical protein